MFYLGNLFSSCVSQIAADKRNNEQLWWLAAIGVGTYVNNVVIPNAT